MKALKRLLITLGVICLVIIVLNVIPPKEAIDVNPFIIQEGEKPLIAAHRGGKTLNPENTFKAMDYSVEKYNVDIIELDLCLTKDEYLILNHNLTLNKTTDVEEYTGSSDEYYVSDHTLEEIQKLNLGYNFEKDGTRPYKDLLDDVADNERSNVLKENDLRIVTVQELFDKYSETDLLFIMEIKDSDARGLRATDILAGLIKEYELEKRVCIGTFHGEVETKLNEDYPHLMKGASVMGAAKFVISQMLYVNLFDNSSFTCLQVPTYYDLDDLVGIKGIVRLDKKTYIERAHRRNISVQYWTINDKEEMRELIELGADVIMTDSPDVLYELLIEMGYRI